MADGEDAADTDTEEDTGPPRRLYRRGTVEFDRAVFLTDGLFAIVLTILVLDLHVPTGVGPDELAHAVLSDWQPFFAFFLTFAILAVTWTGHHGFVAEMERIDVRFLQWNFGYLALVCLMPYASSLISVDSESTFAVVAYLGLIAVMALMGIVGRFVAVGRHLTTDPGYTPVVRNELLDNSVRAAVFGIGIIIALVAPRPTDGLWWLLAYIPASIAVGRRDPYRHPRPSQGAPGDG